MRLEALYLAREFHPICREKHVFNKSWNFMQASAQSPSSSLGISLFCNLEGF